MPVVRRLGFVVTVVTLKKTHMQIRVSVHLFTLECLRKRELTGETVRVFLHVKRIIKFAVRRIPLQEA